MYVNLVGKKKLEGISKKSGNPYNATILYLTFDENGVEGLSCSELYLDNNKFDTSKFVVGDVLKLNYQTNIKGYSQLESVEVVDRQ